MNWRRSVADAASAAPQLDLDLDLDVRGHVMPEEGDAAFAERVLSMGLRLQRADLPSACPLVNISLLFTDDAEIAALNATYRAIDAATDVLSFPQHDGEIVPPPPGLPLLLGDIVVSLPRAAAQAHDYGHTRARELGFLLVHGLLHLLGYDHETPEEAAAMEARQDAVLDALGLSRAVTP